MTSRRAGGPSAPPSAAAFASVTTLFFAWGLITSLIDPLVAAVKGIFSLTNFEAQLTAFAFFIAYGLVSIPAALLVARMRATGSILLAIMLMILACAAILGASNLAAYAGVLAGLFILASGITILQVAANPLAASLGAPERSHFRLLVSQAFNALGTVLGPLLGAHLLLERAEVAPGRTIAPADRVAALAAIDLSFLIVALLLALLAVFIWRSRRLIVAATPAMAVPRATSSAPLREAARSRWTMFGAIAIFAYVGGEVAIGTQMALFLADERIWGISLQRAGYFVSLYWLGAMLGRFAGSFLLMRIAAARMLAVAAGANVMICLFVIGAPGVAAGYAALAIGLFNSIMFPVIFTLTLERSRISSEATSGFLCTAIIGGALVPLAAGAVADHAGYAAAYAIPLLCYCILWVFARAARAAPPRAATADMTPAVHH